MADFDYKNVLQIAILIFSIWILLKVTRKIFKVLLVVLIICVVAYFFMDLGVLSEYIPQL